MSREEIEQIVVAELNKPEYEDMFVTQIAPGLYKIGKNLYTGEEGLKQFNKAMKDESRKD